ncbi:hypothetical protein PPMP20_32090 [Paraburkholderia phymatum]|uniref:Phasin domain-containing protein n=1 Tax=Paraburkholderia phymatum (strain DSM 17167 / CIP 108236 / LMG 21445 / STM815) TaxID=391038 RepID=B2JH69_PARP8|nr:hypothetical protein [Paraburkholderia phymatum]ACC70307.1 hypothetical protein Bphy_1118 [Paraburkholderia phymatum STM815]
MDTFSPEPFGCATMQAFALANTEAFAKWMALCEEAWLRAAAVRTPLEYAAIGSLMLPACASQTMLYCKRISDITAGTHAAGSEPMTFPQTGTAATDVTLSANAASSPAVADSADLTHARTPSIQAAAKRSISGSTSASIHGSIPVPRFRGE